MGESILFCRDSSIPRDRRTAGFLHPVRIGEDANELIDVRAISHGRPVKTGRGSQVNALPEGVPMTREEREQHDEWLTLQEAKELEEEAGIDLGAPEIATDKAG